MIIDAGGTRTWYRDGLEYATSFHYWHIPFSIWFEHIIFHSTWKGIGQSTDATLKPSPFLLDPLYNTLRMWQITAQSLLFHPQRTSPALLTPQYWIIMLLTAFHERPPSLEINRVLFRLFSCSPIKPAKVESFISKLKSLYWEHVAESVNRVLDSRS